MANMAFFCRIISRCWFQQHLKYMYQNKTKWVHLPQICAKVQKSLKQPPKDSEHVQVLNDFFLRSLCTSDIIISKMFKSNKVATTSKHLSCNLIPQVNLVSELGKTRHQGSTLPVLLSTVSSTASESGGSESSETGKSGEVSTPTTWMAMDAIDMQSPTPALCPTQWSVVKWHGKLSWGVENASNWRKNRTF